MKNWWCSCRPARNQAVGEHAFIDNACKVAGGKIQGNGLRRSCDKLLLQCGYQPVLHIGVELVIGLPGIVDIASCACVKNGTVALENLGFELLINSIQENVENRRIPQDTLRDAKVVGQKYGIILHHINSHCPDLSVQGKYDILVHPSGINKTAVGNRGGYASCGQGLGGIYLKRFCDRCLQRQGKKQTCQQYGYSLMFFHSCIPSFHNLPVPVRKQAKNMRFPGIS